MLRASDVSPRMFEDDHLDMLTRTPWWVVLAFWLPIIVGLLTYGVVSRGIGIGASLGVALAGWMVWTLAEYLLHRFFFHWIPDTSWGPTMHFWFHGVHHENAPQFWATYRAHMRGRRRICLFTSRLGTCFPRCL